MHVTYSHGIEHTCLQSIDHMDLNPDWVLFGFISWGPIQTPYSKWIKKIGPIQVYYHHPFQFQAPIFIRRETTATNPSQSILGTLKNENGVFFGQRRGKWLGLWVKDYTLIKKKASVLRQWLRPEGPFSLQTTVVLTHIMSPHSLLRSPHMPACFGFHFMVRALFLLIASLQNS